MFSVIPNVTITPTAPAPAPLIEGRDALVLDCEVDSNPAPAISWYKDLNTQAGGVPRLQVHTLTHGTPRILTVVVAGDRAGAAAAGGHGEPPRRGPVLLHRLQHHRGGRQSRHRDRRSL